MSEPTYLKVKCYYFFCVCVIKEGMVSSEREDEKQKTTAESSPLFFVFRVGVLFRNVALESNAVKPNQVSKVSAFRFLALRA